MTPAPSQIPVPAGMTLSRLDDATAIAQLLQDMRAQQCVAALHLLPEGSADAHTASADDGMTPDTARNAGPLIGLASLQQLDVPARRMAWRLPSALQPLPERVLALCALEGGVRVQLLLCGAWQADGNGWRLETDWPRALLQLQRRRHPRISVPLGLNHSASFSFGSRRSVLDIDNLSAGGLALRGSRSETAMLFVGKKLPKVQLHLAGATVQADLQVRGRRSYRSFLLGEQVLVGCSIEAMGEADRTQLALLLGRGEHPAQA